MKKKISHKVFESIINNVLKHPGVYLIVAVILTVLAVCAITLRFNIQTDLKALMPQDAKSVVDIYKISDRVGSVTTLDIYLKTPKLKEISEELKQSDIYQACRSEFHEVEEEHLLRDKPLVGKYWCDNALMLYALQFVAAIRSIDSIGNVEFHHDKSFFEKNLLLYASKQELQQAYDQIDQTLTEARRQSGEYKACLMVESDPAECESLYPTLANTTIGGQVEEVQQNDATTQFKDMLLDRYRQTELANVQEFPLFPGNNEWIVSLEVRFRDSAMGLDEMQKEIERIKTATDKIDKNSYDPDIYVDYGGGVVDMKSEYSAIILDIASSISFTILSILALIAIFFRSLRATARIITPLVMSTLWSLGITLVVVGTLNLITAFIFAILLGLGIDFGIHLYARYNLERRHGLSLEEAIRVAVVETGSPLFFGALTTSVAFFSLMVSSFPGFSQFGFVAGIGVLLAFCTMSTVMPAMILVMERLFKSKITDKTPPREFSKEFVGRIRPAMLICSLCVLACAGYCLSRLDEVQFEDDFYHLSMRMNSADRKVDMKKFVTSRTYSSPTIAILDNYEQVKALEAYIKRDVEYAHFNRYRKLLQRMPNTAQILAQTFDESYPYLGQVKAFPMLAAMARMMPPGRVDEFALFASYGSEKSQALYKYRELALKMPNTFQSLANLAPEIYRNNTVANGLVWTAQTQQVLPKWLWPALPKYRSAQQLSVISDFASIFSYIPGTDEEQAERLEIIKKIGERTADRQIRFLPDKEKEKIKSLRSYLVEQPIHVDDLPEWVKLQFKESGVHPLPPREGSGVDYTFGNIVVMYQTTSSYIGSQAKMLADQTRSIRVDGKPIVASTGAFVYSDMLDLVKTDGMETAIIALAVILLIAIVQQRRIVPALLVTLPVLTGLVLTLFLMIQFNLKLGLFNIVMLPVILGIGIDGSIYLLQRYQSMGRGSVVEAVRAVLPPVFMSSATTIVGFAGLLISSHGGLNSMGALAVIGIGTCFMTTFLIQPGLIVLTEKLNLRVGSQEKAETSKQVSSGAKDE